MLYHAINLEQIAELFDQTATKFAKLTSASFRTQREEMFNRGKVQGYRDCATILRQTKLHTQAEEVKG